MSVDLGLSLGAYGLGAGIFFIGYFIFEVPSNLWMHRIGARRTLQRILILWGITSASMLFVQSEWLFYVLRFLLGAFEAGFVPAFLLYLTYWYPSVRRGRATATVFIAAAVSGVIGSPASGAILSFTDGMGGLQSWQWLFLFEGIPAIVLGLLVFRVLADGPAQATWLTDEQKAFIQRSLDQDVERAGQQHSTLRSALKDYRVYLLCFVYFSITAGIYLVSFWLPTLVHGLGDFAEWQVGLLTAVPYVCAAVVMMVTAAHSDRTGERRWHVIVLGVLTVGALVLATTLNQTLFVLIPLCVATASVFSMPSIFFTIPPKLLTGVAAAGGIALINSSGNLSGFVTPVLSGYISQISGGSLQISMFAIAALVLAGCFVVLIVVRKEPEKRETIPNPETTAAASAVLAGK